MCHHGIDLCQGHGIVVDRMELQPSLIASPEHTTWSECTQQPHSVGMFGHIEDGDLLRKGENDEW